jgi:hypothetical protein
MKNKKYIIGTVSHGTMRNEDLIPEFVYILRQFSKGKNKAQYKECKEIQKRIKSENYFQSEESDFDLNEFLFDALQDYALPYFYFGSHPGDGSDYGYWLTDNFQEDFDGLIVNDLSAVPKDYAGEIAVVNDHGNISLYHKAKTQEPKEIWAIV